MMVKIPEFPSIIPGKSIMRAYPKKTPTVFINRFNFALCKSTVAGMISECEIVILSLGLITYQEKEKDTNVSAKFDHAQS
jgi:hypothetical protein